MKSKRSSLAMFMVSIILFAIALAFVRYTISNHNSPDMAAAFGLICLAGGFGLLQSLLGRRDRRLFWVGFTAAAAFAILISVWVFFMRPRAVLLLYNAYLGSWEGRYGKLPRMGVGSPGHEGLHFAITALFFFPPQLFIALVGGALANGLGRAGIFWVNRYHSHESHLADVVSRPEGSLQSRL